VLFATQKCVSKKQQLKLSKLRGIGNTFFGKVQLTHIAKASDNKRFARTLTCGLWQKKINTL
jgi:hypothetical protein